MNSLFVAWRQPMPDPTGWRPVGRLEHDGEVYRFWYTRGARKPGFRPFAGMDSLDAVYESDELFPLFANRLLRESRPEYEAVCNLAQGCRPDFIELHVDRVNRDAPLQNRLLCRMHACWPDGFEPCSGEDFAPIPAGVATRCIG